MPKTSQPADARKGRQGPARTRRRNREQTIADILAAAENLLERKGPDGFGLAELGREAGVSFGLIHHYFGGKEGLLRAVLRQTLRDMGREIAALQADGAFWNRDAPAVRVVFETFTRRPGFSRLLAWGLLTGLLTAQDVAEEFTEDREAVERMIESFREGVTGASRESAGATAALLISSVLGFNLLRPVLTSGYGWNEKSDDLLRDQLVETMTALSKRSR